MGLADLHIHSIHSFDGTSSIPAILKYTADNTNLDIIAITDHDSMEGVTQAIDLAPSYGLQVIPGCEISSAEGHVLGLLLTRCVPAGLSFLQTLQLIGEQGGVAIAAHPEAKGASSLSFETIQKACLHPFASQVLVGIEIFNAGLIYPGSNNAAMEQSNNLPLAQTGNSDAHILSMIGQGVTYFPGKTVDDLKIALKHRQTFVATFNNPGGFQVITSYVPQYLFRMMGWAAWNDHPARPIRYTRINRLRPRPSNHVGKLLQQMIST